jgi:hypothetical protein
MLIRRGITFAMCAAVVGSLASRDATGDTHDHDDFRRDVILCEDAAQHLSNCCAGFQLDKLSCAFGFDQTTGCQTTTTTSTIPNLTIDESRCILAEDCNTLAHTNVCERAQSIPPQVSTTTTPATHELVCP